MAAEPILRAKPEHGAALDDPSADRLLELLQDIENGAGAFLIVNKTVDPTGQTYAQAFRNEDGSYDFEYREGNAQRHFGTVAGDLGAAHALLIGWAFELPDWKSGSSWTPVAV